MAKITQDTGHLVGDIQQSMLTEAQIQTEYGTGWVLMDGRDVTGSSYATITGNTTLPDARGQFLRGKNNGRVDGQENPDGDSTLGLQQTDKAQGHTHAMAFAYGGTIPAGSWGVIQNSSAKSSAAANTSIMDVDLFDDGVNDAPRTGKETAPKNITINIFIKINEA